MRVSKNLDDDPCEEYITVKNHNFILNIDTYIEYSKYILNGIIFFSILQTDPLFFLKKKSKRLFFTIKYPF